MKYFVFLLTILPLLSKAQIDTIPNGTVEVVDSLLGIQISYPFKKSKLNGESKAVYANSNRLAYVGSYAENQRQGTWVYLANDSLDADTIQVLNYVNDTLNGAYMKMDDSLRTTASYKGGLLNGSFKQEIKSIDDSGSVYWIPLDSGQYADSIPYGLWTYFDQGRLWKIGFYEAGKMHNNWKIYDTYQSSQEDVLMQEIRYYEGVKTGNEIKHFRYEITENEDGSYDTVKVDEYEQIPWQNGDLMGTYYKKNAAGETLEKGSYENGKKVSTWVYFDPETMVKETKTHLNDKLNGPYIKQVDEHIVLDGTYAMGKKNKEWKYYDDNGKPIREEIYDKDVKTGVWQYFSPKGYTALSKEFEEDQLIQIKEYNDLEVDVLTIDIATSEDKVELVVEEVFEDSVETKSYQYLGGDGKVNHETFMEDFKQGSSDSSLFVLSGGYTVLKGGSKEVVGNYNQGMKDGNWDYFYNTSIIWRVKYVNGIQDGEEFIEKMNSKPVEKGEYVLWYGPERPKIEFKIKEGLRNGKSTWYNRDGSVLKEEKYKEGVLQ